MKILSLIITALGFFVLSTALACPAASCHYLAEVNNDDPQTMNSQTLYMMTNSEGAPTGLYVELSDGTSQSYSEGQIESGATLLEIRGTPALVLNGTLGEGANAGPHPMRISYLTSYADNSYDSCTFTIQQQNGWSIVNNGGSSVSSLFVETYRDSFDGGIRTIQGICN